MLSHLDEHGPHSAGNNLAFRRSFSYGLEGRSWRFHANGSSGFGFADAATLVSPHSGYSVNSMDVVDVVEFDAAAVESVDSVDATVYDLAIISGISDFSISEHREKRLVRYILLLSIRSWPVLNICITRVKTITRCLGLIHGHLCSVAVGRL